MIDWEYTALIIAPVHETAWEQLPTRVNRNFTESIKTDRRVA